MVSAFQATRSMVEEEGTRPMTLKKVHDEEYPRAPYSKPTV
jgi:hypothetical protein